MSMDDECPLIRKGNAPAVADVYSVWRASDLTVFGDFVALDTQVGSRGCSRVIHDKDRVEHGDPVWACAE